MTTTRDTGISMNERRASLRRLDHVRTLEETASLLGMGVQSLRTLLAKGEGPQVTRLSARRIGIRDSHRDQWLDRQAQPHPA